MKKLRKNKDELFTVKTGEHMPVGFALAIYYLEGIESVNEYFCYIGDDCLDVFVKMMDEILTKFTTFPRETMLAMTNDKKMKHSVAAVCYLYSEKYDQKYKNFKKASDHCRYTGKHRGAAHLLSNIKYKEPCYVPLLACNSSAYDNHLILPKTAEKFKECDFYVLVKILKGLPFFH